VDAWLHSVKTGEIYQIEHRVRMSDGSHRWHLSRGVPMLDEKGQLIRWFGTATDIHELKQVEEQAKIYASRLEKSNRELEQFAFMASHDLQEPLRKIEMFGDLLLERATDLQEKERLYLERMRNAASRMRGMIEGLLQISRIATQGRSFVRVDLSGVTQEVLSDFEDQIRDSNASIELGSLPAVNGDPLQLRQLMQNLISNALKYHQPGRPPEIRIFTKQLPEKVQICVQDKGIGFPQADADRIFEPFQRLVARSQYEGSGIGLAICRRIVERHGGDITAVSEPGQGTTFIVNLPRTPGKKTKVTS
jgi:signal transduction histidine kinase